MLLSTPGGVQLETSYLFIDAASLRQHLRDVARKHFGAQTFEIDYKKVRHNYTKAFLYDAVPVKHDRETAEEYEIRAAATHAELSAASKVERLHVYAGDMRYRKGKNQQKKVDVLIAVDMLAHTFRHNMDRCALLTGDLDFKPLLDALVKEGMYTSLLYPPGHTNEELINAADASYPISLGTLSGWLKDSSAVNFKVPQTKYISSPYMGGEPTILQWKDHNGQAVLLQRAGPEYVVIQPVGDIFYRTVWSDIAFLREFFLDTQTMNFPTLEEVIAAESRPVQ